MPEREELYDALEDCLAALEAGASLESALARYPALAAELRSLLVSAQAAGAGADLARVPAGAQVSSRSKFLARAMELGADDQRAAVTPVVGRSWWSRFRAWLRARPLASISPLARAAITSLVVLAGLGAGGYGAVAASAESLPGDPLYGVKRTVESTQLLLAPDDQARTRLQAEFDRRRVSEVQAVASQRRPVAVDFTGTLISINGARGQDWLVSGVSVLVGPQVPVDGQPMPGAQVRVQGIVQTDGEVQAQRVTVLPQGQSSAPDPTASPTATITEASNQPTVTATLAPNVAAATATHNETISSPPPATPVPSATPAPTEDHGAGPSPSHTPEATGTGGGASPSHTPNPTEGGDHGGGHTQTPEATEGGDHGGEQTQTPQATEGGDHGGGHTQTPQATVGGGGGGASPTNTPRPDE